MFRTGVVKIGKPDGRLVGGALTSCEKYGLAHELLDRPEMACRFPGYLLEDDEVGLFDPNGGYIRPESAI